jgi:hypothetical protein
MLSLDSGLYMVSFSPPSEETDSKPTCTDVPSEEAFHLRVSSHRFLGTSTPVHKRGTNAPLALSLLTSSATTIHVVASEQVAPGREVLGTEAYKTRRLKKKIEQAVYFGAGNEENALAFDLPADYEGDLVVAAEAVSAEILASGMSQDFRPTAALAIIDRH